MSSTIPGGTAIVEVGGGLKWMRGFGTRAKMATAYRLISGSKYTNPAFVTSVMSCSIRASVTAMTSITY